MPGDSSKPLTVEDIEKFLKYVDHLEQENTQLKAEIARLKKGNKSDQPAAVADYLKQFSSSAR